MSELDEALSDLEKLIEASARARAKAAAKARAATQPSTRPAATQPATAAAEPNEPPKPKAATTRPADIVPLDRKMLKRLRDMTKRRRHKLTEADITTVVSLGDTLFQAGYLDEAGMFYDMALDEPNRVDDHAWALFQAANCRRTSDPEAAGGLYRRLVAEHPDTPWAFTAQLQHRVLEWKLMNRPEQSVQDALKTIGKPETSTAPAATTQETQVSKND